MRLLGPDDMEVGGHQVGEVTCLGGGNSSVYIISHFNLVTLTSVGAKFSRINVSRWGQNSPGRVRIRVTSNSRQIELTTFGEGSASFKVTTESYNTKKLGA